MVMLRITPPVDELFKISPPSTLSLPKSASLLTSLYFPVVPPLLAFLRITQSSSPCLSFLEIFFLLCHEALLPSPNGTSKLAMVICLVVGLGPDLDAKLGLKMLPVLITESLHLDFIISDLLSYLPTTGFFSSWGAFLSRVKLNPIVLLLLNLAPRLTSK
jgi:hypothetical protein